MSIAISDVLTGDIGISAFNNTLYQISIHVEELQDNMCHILMIQFLVNIVR
jgi:hypothetical protein